MIHRAAAAAVLAAAAGLLAACGSSGPDVSPQVGGTTPVPTHTPPPGLPFHWETVGESSGPSFRVATDATYSVDWTLKGSAQTPNCTVSIVLTSDEGASREVVPPVVLKPTDSKTGTAQVALTAGNWRPQEGGGCSWSVTVNKPA